MRKETDYRKLPQHDGNALRKFPDVGNSVQSDILPVLELDGYAHIPYHVAWQYENHDGG